MEKIIEAYLKKHLTIADETFSDWSCFCPFHSNTNTPSFYVNKRNGLYFCFNPSCGAKGNFSKLVSKLGKEGVEFWAEEPPDLDELESFLSETFCEQGFYSSFEEALDRISVDYEKDVDKVQYLLDRGFSIETIKHFDISYSERQKRIVIPLRDENYRVVGLIGRAISEDQFPKYKYSDKMPKATSLFNIANAKRYRSVIVTEGSLDAIKVHQAGFPNVVATLGASVAKGQIDLLNRYFSEIIIVSDNDDAGEAMKYAILGGCKGKDLYVVQYPEGVKDPGEMTQDQIQNLINSRINVLEHLLHV